MPPPDYNEAAKDWSKGYKGMPPPQGEEDGTVQSPTGRKSRQTSVSSDGMGVKSPPANANTVQSSHSNSPMDTQASAAATTPATAAQSKDAVKSDSNSVEKDETDTGSVNQAAAKPPSEAGSTDATTPTTSASQSVNSEAVTSTAKQQQPDNEAYKRGMEAAFKYHQDQMRKKTTSAPAAATTGSSTRLFSGAYDRRYEFWEEATPSAAYVDTQATGKLHAVAPAPGGYVEVTTDGYAHSASHGLTVFQNAPRAYVR